VIRKEHGLSGFEPVDMSGLQRPVVCRKELVFGRGGDRDLTLDLFRPAKPEERPLPVLVFIHGGGWGGGTKESYHDLAARAASRGYLCASVFYRLAGEAPFPAAIEDCKCAVRWVRSNAAEHGTDGEHIAVWGHSAGGHLAAMVALAPGKFEGEGGWQESSSAVQCAVCFSTPFDLTDKTSGLEGLVTQFIGPTPADRLRPAGGPAAEPDEIRRQASANTYVAGGKTLFLLFHGVEDVLPISQSDRFAAALRDAGVPVELVRVPGAGHDLERFSPDLFTRAIAFLDKHLKPPGGGPR